MCMCVCVYVYVNVYVYVYVYECMCVYECVSAGARMCEYHVIIIFSLLRWY